MKNEVEKLKYWLDAEISVICRIYYWAILGAIIGGWFWVIAGGFMFAGFVYTSRRAAVLPKGYLKVEGERRK